MCRAAFCVPLRTGCLSFFVRDRHTQLQIFLFLRELRNRYLILKTGFIREVNLMFLWSQLVWGWKSYVQFIKKCSNCPFCWWKLHLQIKSWWEREEKAQSSWDLDIWDAYFHKVIHMPCRTYFLFQMDNCHYTYSVLLFSLFTEPVFTKDFTIVAVC